VQDKSKDDALTLFAIGILAFIVADISHEALGHGLAVLAVGAQPVQLTTSHFSHRGSLSRWIPAAGGIANVVVGLLALLALRIFRRTSPHLRYFFVLAAAFNLLFAVAYPAYSGIALFGDWAAVISGLSPAWLWRILLVAFSGACYYLSLQLVASAIRPFCGSAQPEVLTRVQRITLIPYFAALVTASVAGAFNPAGWTTMFTAALPAAAAAFGLTQMDHLRRAQSSDPSVSPAGLITRSLPWIVAATIALAFFVGVLGPGINFGAQS
jgi:hypothetical protein